MSRNLDPSDPDFDDTVWPQWLPTDELQAGLCYCQRCHLTGAEWSFRGEAFHADCAAKAMGITNETAL
jgi:hypothetical protein